MLVHFNDLFDYIALIAKKHCTFRVVTPTHSEIYITDPVCVEHILKSNFQNYTKVCQMLGHHKLIMGDLFGNGIFAVDGDVWRHQRKLASLEFSTKVLRDFSTAVFRANTAKLVKMFSESADLLMRSTLDSIFKVGFGFYQRYVDLLRRAKRHFNIRSEASLKKKIRVIDNFVYELIERKREQMKNTKDDRDKKDISSRFLIEREKNPANLTDQYLRDISLSFIIAGKDTSANTLTWKQLWRQVR
ncbi:putative abieta-7,13-dien-18-ol hydroxylase [Helianthus anomalus]